MAAKPTVGFAGVGYMGHGMAKNIVEKGYPLTILGHRNREPVDDLVRRGAVEVPSAKDLAAASEIIFICVTGSRQVEDLVRRADGLGAGVRKGSIIVDCSTSDPVSTLALAAELAAKGVHFIDAPLGGTPAQAETGKLSTMVGAPTEVFERVKPVCETWAAKVDHIGDVGVGHKMKLINNFLSLGYGAIYAEALTLAQKTGISPAAFDKVIRGGRMDCGFYQTFFQYVLTRDRDAHKFTIANAAKDTRYLASLADAEGVANPIGAAVKNAYAAAEAGGKGGDFVPMLSDFVAAANGVKLA
jgi:3-hydroxyisobutyrate dehydrogenase-like beta-hydroxyacid dehydrogenase